MKKEVQKNKIVELIRAYFNLYDISNVTVDFTDNDRIFSVTCGYNIKGMSHSIAYMVTNDYFERRLTNHQNIYIKALIETIDASIRENIKK